MEIRVIGIDLANSVFHLVGMDQHGKVVARKRLSRSQMMVYTARIRPCLIGMEACCGAHFLGAALVAQGHEVMLTHLILLGCFASAHQIPQGLGTFVVYPAIDRSG